MTTLREYESMCVPDKMEEILERKFSFRDVKERNIIKPKPTATLNIEDIEASQYRE